MRRDAMMIYFLLYGNVLFFNGKYVNREFVLILNSIKCRLDAFNFFLID